jgi:hypothetical protein
MDYATLETLVARHPGWQLLRHADAPLAASVLHRTFIEAEVRTVPAGRLLEALDDALLVLRRQRGDAALPRTAESYIDTWSAAQNGWLRKLYVVGTDEPQYELTPATAQALGWLAQLDDPHLAGTESRLLALIDLLAHVREIGEHDPARRIELLRMRRDAIDAEIEQMAAGAGPVLDRAALEERLQQLLRLSDDLLLAFGLADDTLRARDHALRASVAAAPDAHTAEDALARALNEIDAARSLRAAWERLVLHAEHESLSEAVAEVLALPAIAAMPVAERMQRIPYAWLNASDAVRRTLAQRSERLGQFASRRVWEEERCIAALVAAIDAQALARAEGLHGEAAIRIPATMSAMPLRAAAPSAHAFVLEEFEAEDAASAAAAAAAFDATLPVDSVQLAHHVEQALQTRTQVSLREVVESYPLRQGLAEVLGYVALAQTRAAARIDAATLEPIAWDAVGGDGAHVRRQALAPRIVFER